jgi:TonB family protein
MPDCIHPPLYYHSAMLRMQVLTPLCCSVCFALALSALPCNAQTPAAPLPTDPAALMQQAARTNGLAAAGIPSWRLKANYTLYDNTGAAARQGTYEVLWAGPQSYKRIVDQPPFHQVEFDTAHGLLRSGDQHALPRAFDELQMALMAPLPSAENLAANHFKRTQRKVEQEKLTCMEQKDLPEGVEIAYCFGNDSAAVRAMALRAGQNLTERISNRVLSFEGHTLPGDVTIRMNGQTMLTAHVELIERLAETQLAELAPTADAVAVHRRVNVSIGVAQGMLASKVPPRYPQDAKEKHISGTVVLAATIGTDGTVQQLSAESGPQELQQAAIDCVRQWRYRPYLLNNEAVEVHTKVNVIFAITN